MLVNGKTAVPDNNTEDKKCFRGGTWQVLPPCFIIIIRLNVIIQKDFYKDYYKELNKDIKIIDFDWIYSCRYKRILEVCKNEQSLDPEDDHFNSKNVRWSNYPCPVGAGLMTGPWRIVRFLSCKQGTVEKFNWRGVSHFASVSKRKIKITIAVIPKMCNAMIRGPSATSYWLPVTGTTLNRYDLVFLQKVIPRTRF